MKSFTNKYILSLFKLFFATLAFLLLVIITVHTFSIQSNNYNLETNSPIKEVSLETEKKLNKYIVDVLEAKEINYKNYEIKEINNTYVNVVIETDTFPENLVINVENSKILEFDDLFKPEEVENIHILINKYLHQKYPKFISGSITNNTDFTYEINESNIVIYFINVVTEPQYTGEIKIVLNSEDIYDRVIYEVILSSEKDSNLIPLDPIKPTIALTFDDGPLPEYSLSLLEALNDNKINATFFILGDRLAINKDILLKGIEYGNEYGSHSFSHKYLTKINTTTLDLEINETNRLFKELTGVDLKLLRPPYGAINTDIMNNYPMIYVKWSIDTLDWKNRDAQYLKNYILENITDGDIVLLHDIHLTSVEAAKLVLPELYVRGFQVTTVSNLASLRGITLNEHELYRNFK